MIKESKIETFAQNTVFVLLRPYFTYPKKSHNGIFLRDFSPASSITKCNAFFNGVKRKEYLFILNTIMNRKLALYMFVQSDQRLLPSRKHKTLCIEDIIYM